MSEESPRRSESPGIFFTGRVQSTFRTGRGEDSSQPRRQSRNSITVAERSRDRARQGRESVVERDETDGSFVTLFSTLSPCHSQLQKSIQANSLSSH